MRTDKTVTIESIPSDGIGLYVVIEITCGDKEKIFEVKQWKFWLPKSTPKAAVKLREHLAYNRLVGIPDDMCEKYVKFIFKKTKPTLGYQFIKNQLVIQGVKVDEVYESDSQSADKH